MFDQTWHLKDILQTCRNRQMQKINKTICSRRLSNQRALVDSRAMTQRYEWKDRKRTLFLNRRVIFRSDCVLSVCTSVESHFSVCALARVDDVRPDRRGRWEVLVGMVTAWLISPRPVQCRFIFRLRSGEYRGQEWECSSQSLSLPIRLLCVSSSVESVQYPRTRLFRLERQTERESSPFCFCVRFRTMLERVWTFLFSRSSRPWNDRTIFRSAGRLAPNHTKQTFSFPSSGVYERR